MKFVLSAIGILLLASGVVTILKKRFTLQAEYMNEEEFVSAFHRHFPKIEGNLAVVFGIILLLLSIPFFLFAYYFFTIEH